MVVFLYMEFGLDCERSVISGFWSNSVYCLINNNTCKISFYRYLFVNFMSSIIPSFSLINVYLNRSFSFVVMIGVFSSYD